ncbi:3-hydroxyacyl-CoA dehydrogenase family protein [Streptosporangium amethystogenes]|uniref:3-hydroxyacyl-CoA dehydrogenase family protein n=1 Tax=Streptosporangium amethystogenes TaxID=2002 RepID=UPI0004C90BEA|nr:3-hydroxyacyl-CoA dehydrogenase family protein [Streptosporangium amethystogenes]
MSGLPGRVVVYGGGRMGAGIAHAFASRGSEVTILEVDDDAAARALARVERDLRRSAGDDAGRVGSRLAVASDPRVLAGAELVIEAVPERPDVKLQVLRTAHRYAPDAVLASNTSSLSIDELADGLPRPELFVGLHFFNPVPASTLVEIVVGRMTAATLVERATSWVEALGKAAVTIRDSPGFASSRLGVALALEAIRMVEEGVATAEDIDNVLVLGYRHATGPLRTTDLVGLDVRLAIAEELASKLGPRFAPPRLLVEKVAAGELGRKSGRGFFDWPRP